MKGTYFESLCLQLAVYILIILACSTAFAKKCFNCSSLIDARCRDPFNPINEFIIDCPAHGECQKLMLHGQVSRYCLVEDGPRAGESSLYEQVCFQKLIQVTDTIPFLGTRSEEQLVTICNCDNELCNESTAIKTPYWWFAFCILIILCIY